MDIQNISADVRIVYHPVSAARSGDDVVIEQRVDGRWIRASGFNSLSDDYAYTNAQASANRLAEQLLRQPQGEAPCRG